MTQKQKINYMRIAAGICGFGFSCKQMDLLVSLYEEVISKGGDADLMGLSKIQAIVNERYKPKKNKQ